MTKMGAILQIYPDWFHEGALQVRIKYLDDTGAVPKIKLSCIPAGFSL
jgi:hypothetical protein